MHETLLKNAHDLHRAGRVQDAARIYAEILRTDPRHFDALYSLGVVYSQSGRLEDAQSVIAQALSVNPESLEAWHAQGCLLHRMGRLEEAIASYDKALAIRPDFIEALNNRGGAFGALNRHGDALASFERALRLQPNNPQLVNNRANALLMVGRYDEALAGYDRALAIEPNFIDALAQRGALLIHLGRHQDAIVSFSRALTLNPSRPDLLYNRGTALAQLRRYEDALPDFDKALQSAPENADLLYSRGNALDVLKRYEEAMRDLRKALAINPDYPYARGILLHAQLQSCDWRNLEEEKAAISAGLRAGKHILSPFDNGVISESTEEQLTCARIWASHLYPARESVWRGEHYRHDKIRVAYLSGDFRAHPVSFQMAGIFESHDRARFETMAVDFTPEHTSPIRTRLKAAFDRFIGVRERSDTDVARMMREWEVDIAVDLTGWTRECRTGIFAQRPAPIQVNYLGYPGTMGADYYDYIVADGVVVPEGHEPFYSEKIVRLPGSFMPNDSKPIAMERLPTRSEAGLPDASFVFCCFNGNYKITPQHFDIWMRLLQKVEASVLWLPKPNETALRNLRREAEARGIAAERIVFAPFVPETHQHLARLRLADLFLDTLPYGAHSTACDALGVGLPVLTCLGPTFPGRVAASVLQMAGLPELITSSLADYENLALALAREPARLEAIKARLLKNRETAALFDPRRFSRQLEAAYIAMYENHQRGEKPAHIALPKLAGLS